MLFFDLWVVRKETIPSLMICKKADDDCPEGEDCDSNPPTPPCTGTGCNPPNPPPPCIGTGCNPNPPPCTGEGCDDIRVGGRLMADPHIITSDGLGYNFFASGDYILSRIEEMQNEYEIQGRFLPGFETSWPQAIALRVGNDIVEVQSSRANIGRNTFINSFKIWVNSERIDILTDSNEHLKLRGIRLPSGGNIIVD